MFFFRHPKPVVDGRAVAVQVVQQKAVRKQVTVLVVAKPEAEGPDVVAPADTNAPGVGPERST
jgi:predicted thioesterase